jgi:hypothetical protein
MKVLKHILSYVLIEVILIAPISALLPSLAFADTNPISLNGCVVPSDSTSATPTTKTDPAGDPGDAIDLSGTKPTTATISLAIAKLDPLFDQDAFTANMQAIAKSNNGSFDSSSQTWSFCTNRNMEYSTSFLPVGTDFISYMSTLADPLAKVTFSNPLDRHALLGEACTLWIESTSQCDETLGADGKPLYFTDEFTSGASYNHWDAPKADARILKTLVYLTTPTDLGGAGREHINVSKILQMTSTNTEVLNSSDPDNSAFTYDLTNPEHPSKVSQAMDIDQIDNLRITTKITMHSRIGDLFGSNQVSYQYSSTPIQVAWQTNAGAKAATTPSDYYSGALGAFTTSLGQLLDQMGLSGTIDLNSVNLNDLGSVADVVGMSLITTVLNSPNGSVKGWDLDSVLDQLGRAYIAQNLGLDTNALSKGSTVNELVQQIGRTTVERSFDLPSNSLEGSTSADILSTLGRRYVEDTLQIHPGSLAVKQYSQSNLLEQIGEGRIEQRFNLPLGSFSGDDWSKIINTPKTKLTFAKSDAGYVDDALSLGFIQNGATTTDAYGFSAGDYVNPTLKLVQTPTAANVVRYKQMVGARAIASSIGKFTTGTGSNSTNASESSNDFLSGWFTAMGLTVTKSYSTYFPTGLAILSNYRPKDSQTLYTVTGNSTTQRIIDNGFLTLAQIKTQTQLAIDEQVANTYVLDAAGTNSVGKLFSVPRKGTVYGPKELIPYLNKVTSNWKNPIQALYSAITTDLDNVTTGAMNGDIASLLAIQGSISTELGLIRSFSDALQTGIDVSGQSGRAAALSVPGILFKSNSDGTFDTSTVISGDPIAEVFSGNVTTEPLAVIGKILISSKTVSDRTGQRSLAGQIKTDLSPLIGQLAPLVTSWVSKGFQNDDFERIFTKDLGNSTFERIGTLELLRVAWNKSDIQGAIDTTSTTAGVNKAIAIANQVVAGFDFYDSRITQLTALSSSISGMLAADANNAALKAQLDAANKGPKITTIKAAQARARLYESVLHQIQAKATDPALLAQVNQAVLILEELAAGHSLAFTQTIDAKPSSSSSASYSNGIQTCLNPTDFTTLIQTKGDLKTFVRRTAACQIDLKLQLPVGSIYEWYSNKDYTYDGFTLAVGDTYYKAARDTNHTDAEKRTKGVSILESVALSTILGKVPGISGLLSTYHIDSHDLYNLLTGNSEAFVRKLGGSMLDTYFNWKPGTASHIIAPQCLDPETNALIACSQAQATNVREIAIGQMGLNALGLSLGLPSTLDLTQGGDFPSQLANAQISEALGLQPNTFKGTLSDVRNANRLTLNNLLSGFSWYQSAFVSGLMAERAALVSAAASVPNSDAYRAIQSTLTSLDAHIATINNEVLDAMAAGETDTSLLQNLVDLPAKLYEGQYGEFANAALDLHSLLGSDTLSDSQTQALEAMYTSLSTTFNKAQNDATWKQQQKDAFAIQMSSYSARLTSLDAQFNLKAGTFNAFMTGKMTADQITKQHGTEYIARNFTDQELAKVLKGTPFAALYSTFTELTKTPDCPSGLSVSDFFVPSSSVSVGCRSSTIQDVSLSSILTGDSSIAIQQRAYLYDALLGRAWGAQTEKNLGVQPGTLRAIAMQPWKAKDIAVDQGIRLIGAKLLGLVNSADLENASDQAVLNSFISSLMAGFCAVNPITPGMTDTQRQKARDGSMCTLNFDQDRALDQFANTLNTIVADRFASQSNGSGVRIGLADVSMALMGGVEGITYLAAADLASSLNASLGNDARGNSFKIRFSDIRNSYGSFSLTDADLAAGVPQGQANAIRDYYYDQDSDSAESIRSVSNGQLIQQFNADTSIPDATKQEILANGADTGREAYQERLQAASQERLKYQIYDIGAFKTDPNIPAGFSHAMLKGTSAERSHYLGLYLANTLNLAGSSFFAGSGLTNETIVSLGQYAATCFTGGVCDQNLLTGPGLSQLDTWFDSKSASLLGVALPPGTVQGIFAWGTKGFTGNTFDTADKTTLAGTAYPPLGSVLKSWGYQNLFTWADKTLGFDAGSSYQIYSSAITVVNAYKQMQYFKDSADILNFAGEQAGLGAGVGTQLANQAKAQLTAAEAELIGTAVNIVFKNQIGDAEKQLGLVPGTGATLVSMLVMLAMGVPVSPVSIALFVIGNLFGTYKTDIETQATASGYYPFTGYYGATGFPETGSGGGFSLGAIGGLIGAGGGGAAGKGATIPQIPTSDPDLGTFNAKDAGSYRLGIKAAAQSKVYSLLRDLLIMPIQWEKMTGEDGKYVWISQIFTTRQEDAEAVTDLTSQPGPWEGKGTFGYGLPSEQVARAQSGQYAGLSACQPIGGGTSTVSTCGFTDHIYLRW